MIWLYKLYVYCDKTKWSITSTICTYNYTTGMHDKISLKTVEQNVFMNNDVHVENM